MFFLWLQMFGWTVWGVVMLQRGEYSTGLLMLLMAEANSIQIQIRRK